MTVLRWLGSLSLALTAAGISAGCASSPPTGGRTPSGSAGAPVTSGYPRPSARADSAPAVRAPARRVPGSRRLFTSPEQDAAADGPMRIHFIDVGQGDATLIELPCGAMLVDTGGESVTSFTSTERLVAYLDQFFARRPDLGRTLDLLILTHQHIDHTRGATRVRQEFAIRRVADNGESRSASGSSQQNSLRQWALDNGVEYLPIRAAEIELRHPDDDDMAATEVEPLRPIAPCAASALRLEVSFLWGDADTTEGEMSNPNNHSVTLRADWGDASVLFTGDLQLEGIERLIDRYGGSSDLLDADIFQVGHHGSHNATTEALVDLISPRLAVFSAGDPARHEGQFNAFRFAHPNYKALRILDDPWRGVSCSRAPVDVPVGIKGAFRERPPVWEEWTLESALFSTGWDGDIVVDALSDGRLSVTTERQQAATGFGCP